MFVLSDGDALSAARLFCLVENRTASFATNALRRLDLRFTESQISEAITILTLKSAPFDAKIQAKTLRPQAHKNASNRYFVDYNAFKSEKQPFRPLFADFFSFFRVFSTR
jgi:hypothetical protein